MLKYVSFGLIAATSSFITSAVLGDSLIRAIMVAPLAGSGAVILWMVGAEIAYRQHLPGINAASMDRGVCPACRTFRSLEEVTSDEPDTRAAHCLACDERFVVTMENGSLAARSIGKAQ